LTSCAASTAADGASTRSTSRARPRWKRLTQLGHQSVRRADRWRSDWGASFLDSS
jgi:hypothetical protein